MNKFRYFIIFIFCILLTGCGKQTLKCTKSEKNDVGKSTSKIVIVFNDNNMTNAEIETTIVLDDDYSSYSNVMVNSISNSLKSYTNKKGIKTDIVTSNNEIKTSIKFDLSKMSKNDKDIIGFDTSSSRKSIKTYYEKNKYTCK